MEGKQITQLTYLEREEALEFPSSILVQDLALLGRGKEHIFLWLVMH